MSECEAGINSKGAPAFDQAVFEPAGQKQRRRDVDTDER
jgi:hypothetical protein